MMSAYEPASAAIVCREIAVEHSPILYAARSEPEEPADSGWQFLCGAGDEEVEAAHVWSLKEVLAYEPSLGPFLGYPVGTVLTRSSPNAKWTVARGA
jgi:hypothetical protein